MFYKNIREEELKNRVGEEYFSDYDCATEIPKTNKKNDRICIF